VFNKVYPYEYDDYLEDDYYLDDEEYGYRQFPSGPPFGLPGGGGFFPPGGGPGPGGPGGPGGAAGGPPPGPPPSFTPSQSQAQGGVGTFAVDPGSLFRCRFRFVYIWLDNGSSFWAYITFVGRRSIAGFRWQRRRWVYFGIDTRRIDSFICY
jgi:hypothetical protein